MSTNTRKPRKVWSKQENLDLVYCYYSSNPGTSGSWKRLERLWEDKGHGPMTGKQLASQFRSIEKSEHMLTPQEMAEQRMAATGLNVLPVVDLTVNSNTAGPSTTPSGDAESDPPNPNPNRAARTKWSKEMNSTLVFIHWLAQPDKRGVWNRVKEKWAAQTTYPPKTSDQLRSQLKSITDTGLISPQQLMEIREAAEAERDMQSAPQAEPEDNPPPEPIPPANIEDEEPAPDPEVRELFKKLLEEPSLIKVTDLRQVPWGKLRVAIDRLSPVIRTFEVPDLTTLNTLLMVVAHVVREQMGIEPPSEDETTSQEQRRNKKPMWLRRLEDSVGKLRSDLSRLTEMSRGTTQKFQTIDIIYRRYPLLPKKGYKQVIEEVKQRLQAKAGKIRRYKRKQQTFLDNNLFQNNQRNFYRKLEKRGSDPTPLNYTPEDQTRTLNFWKNIWENEAGHNNEAEWLDGVQENFEAVNQQEEFQITTERVAARVKGMTNWSSPGIDGLHAFWIKHTTCLHGRIAELLNESLATSQVPAWMTEGRTFLIIKDPKKGTSNPGNFRPITCLPNLWKLYTGILSEDIYQHLDLNKLFPEEQKGCRKKSRGCKEQLAIDKLILRHCKRTKSSLYMAFIDYQKAYDSIPHSWILKAMEMCKINPQIIRLFESSFQQCVVNIVQSGSALGKIHIKRGLFQGDAVSPIHFIVGLIPLSLLLTSQGKGYNIPNPEAPHTIVDINHRLYMDDLKLYSSSREDLQQLLEVTEKFSTDINMSFGISKCGSLDIVNGVREHMQGIELPSGQTIPEVEDGGYKYLGILEVDCILHQEMKAKVKTEYIRRVKKLLSSNLNGKNLISAINTWAIPVIRYGAGILEWTNSEAKGLDNITRRHLRRGVIKSNSDVDRLYVTRKLGGRGLQRIEDVIVKEEIGLVTFFSNSTDPKIGALHTCMKKEDMLNGPPENAEALKERLQTKLVETWKSKVLHGRFLKQLEEGGCDPDATWAWLNKESLSRYTEADIFAAQDQAIRTNWLKAAIEKQTEPGLSEKCRICNQHNESVEHILNGCTKLSNGDYKHRHDRVAAALHWGMCRDYGFPAETKWYSHYAEKVLENDNYKILWDFHIQTDNPIEACKPDLVLLDKQKKEALLIDVAVPKDRIVSDREMEKIEKYQELRREITRIWGLKKATVIPIVIGALGGVSPRLEKYLRAVTRQIYPSQLQKSVLFNSINTLRKVLDM